MTRARRRLTGLVAVTAAIGACVLFVDRPVARWMDDTLSGTAAFGAASAILWLLDGLFILTPMLLVVAIVWRRRGAPHWVSRFMIGFLAAALALAGALIFKIAIGRSQVYPLFLLGDVYTWRPFDRHVDFMAFPSATMAGVGAFFAAITVRRWPQRAVAVAIPLVLALALLVTNSHWLSDLIGGTYLGMVIGGAVMQRLRHSTPKGMMPATADAALPRHVDWPV